MDDKTQRWNRQRPPARRAQDPLEEHVLLARRGDAEAWSEIVRRFERMLWAVVRAHRLSSADAADAIQTTWLRLAESIDRVQDPSRVGAWLATTARRECVRILRNRARELPEEQPPEPRDNRVAAVDRPLLLADCNTELWAAFARLPARDRRLLRLLVAEPQPSYESVASALDMPIGSIGPTRGRALERLRRELEWGELDDLAA